jgi:hypothetical protein
MIARIFQGYYLTGDGRITHFTRSELSCKDSCGLSDMREETIDALEAARLDAGQPLFPTSGVRCGAWNTQKGGSPDSPHMRGLAVDLSWSVDTFSLWLLLRRHFRRVCMYSKSKGGHCHADMWITDKIIWDVVTRDGNFLIANSLEHYRITLARDFVNEILEAT